jgi:CBS-domain-containing membrane protein
MDTFVLAFCAYYVVLVVGLGLCYHRFCHRPFPEPVPEEPQEINCAVV